MTSPKPFTGREWFLFVALLMVVEFGILEFSYRFASDELVLSHISLVGTIVGILLAVIAIVYGFIQTSSRQSSGETIAAQVQSLESVVLSLDTSKKDLNQELTR